MISASKTKPTMEKDTQFIKERTFINAQRSFASEVGFVIGVSVSGEVACFFLNFIFCSFTALKTWITELKHRQKRWKVYMLIGFILKYILQNLNYVFINVIVFC